MFLLSYIQVKAVNIGRVQIHGTQLSCCLHPSFPYAGLSVFWIWQLIKAKMSKPHPLSGKFQNSFAYPTLKDRVPIIVCKVIDLVSTL